MARDKASPKRSSDLASKSPSANEPERARLGASVRQQFETLKAKVEEQGYSLKDGKIEVLLPKE